MELAKEFEGLSLEIINAINGKAKEYDFTSFFFLIKERNDQLCE